MKFNSVLSDVGVNSTGALQGCVSSPFLFTLYTNDWISQQSNLIIMTFLDDTVLLHLLTRDCSTDVEGFVDWCDNHY